MSGGRRGCAEGSGRHVETPRLGPAGIQSRVEYRLLSSESVVVYHGKGRGPLKNSETRSNWRCGGDDELA